MGRPDPRRLPARHGRLRGGRRAPALRARVGERLRPASRSVRRSRCSAASTCSAASSRTRVHVLDRALDEVAARGMTAFVPWPESFRGELDLRRGRRRLGGGALRARLRPRVARSATPAGRASACAGSGSSRPRAATLPARSSCSSTRRSCAAACPTRTSGSRPTGSTRSARSRSSTAPRPRALDRRARGVTARRGIRGSSCARPSTGLGSASPARSRRRSRSPRRSTIRRSTS